MTAPDSSLSSDIKAHDTCRVCGSRDLVLYCDLGVQPLANALVVDPAQPEFQAPLAVQHCAGCGLSQLTHTVSPERLYADYPFRSGTSKAWVEHTQILARRLMEQFPGGGAVLDIACNDGTQLSQFGRLWRITGFDPSPCVSEEFRDTGQVVPNYWSSKQGTRYREWANVIIAQNVLGHVDNVHDFVEGIKIALAPKGVCVIEVPDLWEMFERRAFDTIYHEHLSYWSVEPLRWLLDDHGLYIDEEEKLDIHGGSRRYWVRHGHSEASPAVRRAPSITLSAGREFASMSRHGLDLAMEVLPKIGRHAAYGASAKGTVRLNMLRQLGNTVWPEFIVDDTPGKQGKYVPGVHIPIVAPRDLSDIDFLWLLSWNWREELEAKAKDLGFVGMFL